MFSILKNQKEKKLIKLGFQSLIDAYKEKVNSGEWTKKVYKKAIEQLYQDKKTAIHNTDNIQVFTRQSFDDNEVTVPLNLQNIQQHYIDYDFVYSSLLFEYKNHKKIQVQALDTLEKWLKEKYPTVEISPELKEELQQQNPDFLVDEAIKTINTENASYIKTIFSILKNRA